MNGLERTRRAIYFQGPDHIPHFLPDGKDNDILWIWIPRPPEIQPWVPLPDGRDRRIDCWGITWERGEKGSYGEAKDHPIKDVTRQAEYVFPDILNPQYFDDARIRIAENQRSVNPKYCLGVLPFNSLHEGAHNLMGLDRLFVSYYEHPAHLKALIGRLAENQRKAIHLLAKLGCHGVMAYDDWGLQDRPMISPALIEEFYLPHYHSNWQLAHELSMEVWMHSCGYIIDLLPMFVRAGLNVIQQDQQENMGLENLDRAVGGKIAFWCPVDIQKTMAQGSTEDIRRYVLRMMRTIGSHRGGLISMAYSTPEAVNQPPEKVAAMCASFREFGVY